MKATKDAAELTRQLLEDMPGRRRAVVLLLAYLRDAHTPEAVRAEIARIQAHDASAYSAGSYCMLLEEAGAIERLAIDGAVLSNERQSPEVVEEDGGRFYKPGPKLAFMWKVTQAGAQVLRENDPDVLIDTLMETDGKYRDIYARIMRMCTQQGCPISVLNDAVDLDPLVQEPPLKASHFVERLEKAGVLAWDGLWMTTDAGIDWLGADAAGMRGSRA